MDSLKQRIADFEKVELHRKKTEEALRESEQRFRSLFENSLDGMMVTVTDGTILLANARMCEMLGMSEEEIIHEGRNGVVVQDERLAAGLKERARTGMFQGELTFCRKDGSLMPVEISSYLFKDLGGTIKSGQVVRDITERKHSEQALKQAYDEMELRAEQRTAEIKRQAELLDLAYNAILVDVVARYGGEEFLILLTETAKAAALEVAEKIRAAVSVRPFPHAGTQPEGKLTISLGVATSSADLSAARELIYQADHALYGAKHAGRNRVREA